MFPCMKMEEYMEVWKLRPSDTFGIKLVGKNYYLGTREPICCIGWLNESSNIKKSAPLGLIER